MQISRRNFLQTAGAAVTFAVAGGSSRMFAQRGSGELFPIPPEVYSEAIYSLTAAQAQALIGTSFTLTLAGGRTVRLTLTQVNPLERQANILRGYYGESFSLVFETPQRLQLAQGIYRVTGEGLDLPAVLLVPTDRARRQYEIVVNHLTR